jgi:hypothetical protein
VIEKDKGPDGALVGVWQNPSNGEVAQVFFRGFDDLAHG